jgi:hypothetical protein
MFGPVERVPEGMLATVRLHLAALLGIEVPIGSR